MFLFLLPPSEGKESGGAPLPATTIFDLPLPLEIATHASEKDLKCKDKRYEKALRFNAHVTTAPTLAAIDRYTGIMFKALDYDMLDVSAQQRLNQHVLICSGMYGLVAPADRIANYKLPISTKGLYKYRKEQSLTQKLIDHAQKNKATIIDLLPQAHHKMIDRDLLAQADIPTIHVAFFRQHRKRLKKLTHAVKAVKGKWLRKIATQHVDQTEQLGEITEGNQIDVITK